MPQLLQPPRPEFVSSISSSAPDVAFSSSPPPRQQQQQQPSSSSSSIKITSSSSSSEQLLRILMVGEGDFSASLAILRAYYYGSGNDDGNDDGPKNTNNRNNKSDNQQPQPQPTIILVMTTLLPSSTVLYETYPDTAANNIRDIQQILSNHHWCCTTTTTTTAITTTNSNDNDNTVNNCSDHDDFSCDSNAVTILYGIDACQLHHPDTKQRLQQQLNRQLRRRQQQQQLHSNNINNNNMNDHPVVASPKSCHHGHNIHHAVDDDVLFDLVIFQYPHLGIGTTTTTTTTAGCTSTDDESIRRQRHVSLVHHYLYSASHIATHVHVTLNQHQYQSWIMNETPGTNEERKRWIVVTTTTTATNNNEHSRNHNHCNNIVTTTTTHSNKRHQSISTTAPTVVTTTTTDPYSHCYNTKKDITTTNVRDNMVPHTTTGTTILQQRLQLQKVIPVQRPFHFIFPVTVSTLKTSTTAANNTVRRRRVSKKYDGGSHRHYLTKYGYHHVRTITPTTASVDNHHNDATTTTTSKESTDTKQKTKKKLPSVSLFGSCHYVFERIAERNFLHHGATLQPVADCESNVIITTNQNNNTEDDPCSLGNENNNCKGIHDENKTQSTGLCLSCPICGVSCSDPSEYRMHLQNPTLYPIIRDGNSTTTYCDTTPSEYRIHLQNPTPCPIIRDGNSATTYRDTTNSRNDIGTVPTADENLAYGVDHNVANCDSCVDEESVVTPMYETVESITSLTGTFTTAAGSINLNDAAAVVLDKITKRKSRKEEDEVPLFTSSRRVDDKITLAYFVTTEYVGKRLRWFLQNAIASGDETTTKNTTRTIVGFSKRQSERLIQNGFVSINDEIVTDSSRILHEVGWVVRVMDTKQYIPTICSNNELFNISANVHHDHDTVTLRNPELVINECAEKVIIVEEHPLPSCTTDRSLLVVWKPVGMRTIGSFTNTLEQYLYNHRQQLCEENNGAATVRYQYKSLSKLDKCCSGLCVLQQQVEEGHRTKKPIDDPIIMVQHTYTALIYGNNCPEEWRNGALITLPVHGLRRWNSNKRQRRRQVKITDQNKCSDNDDETSSYANGGLDDGKEEEEEDHIADDTNNKETEATIALIEETADTDTGGMCDIIPALSTISISTSSIVSGLAQTIGYYLRKNKYAIVGDRMAVQEYNQLPRAVRNRIKQRLCLGCTSVRVNTTIHSNDSQQQQQQQQQEQCFETKQPIPSKWSALYWQEFCRNQTTL